MRVFYIFNINKEFSNLTRYNPYNLYKTMEDIHCMKSDELNIGYTMYKQMIKPFNKNKLNELLFNKYKNDDHYTKYNNKHMLYNFYTDEQSKLIINNTYMVLKTTKINPTFFEDFKNIKNIFICDFKNKDYFWLEQVL